MQQQRLAIFRSQSSHLDPRGEDDDAYENDSEDDDGSKSSTPPPHPPPPPCPTDFSPSNSTTAGFPTIGCGTLQLSSFTGNVTQMLGEGEGPTSMFPECSTSPRNYSRRVTQESNNSTGFDHVGGCDSSYLAHSPSFEWINRLIGYAPIIGVSEVDILWVFQKCDVWKYKNILNPINANPKWNEYQEIKYSWNVNLNWIWVERDKRLDVKYVHIFVRWLKRYKGITVSVTLLSHFSFCHSILGLVMFTSWRVIAWLVLQQVAFSYHS